MRFIPKLLKIKCMAISVLCLCTSSYAAMISTELYDLKGISIGKVIFEDSKYGLLVTPKLHHLSVGAHGFHIHEHPNCADHAMKAEGHFDPKHSDSHQGPYGNGHLGDLPVLLVDDHGKASLPILAPRLTTSDIVGHALMIHANGDNYSDTLPLGGGGARIGCGKIEK